MLKNFNQIFRPHPTSRGHALNKLETTQLEDASNINKTNYIFVVLEKQILILFYKVFICKILIGHYGPSYPWGT